MAYPLSSDPAQACYLPLIDLTGLLSSDSQQRNAVAGQIGQACREWGFFYIYKHGIDARLQAAVFEQTRQLFDRPDEAKRALDKAASPANRGYEALRGQCLEPGAPADLKEGFYLGRDLPADDPRVQAGRFNHGPNQWPASLPGFRPAMERYHAAMTDLAERLMAGLALSLELPENYFAGFCDEAMATLRLLHYPPQPAMAAPGEKGCGAHTDFGGLTLLLQDDNPGLQVWNHRAQAWMDAPPLPGTYVVNLGDMIARWTNDRYRSTLHRVVNLSGHERYSVPFFYGGNPDHQVSCIPTCLEAGEAPRYPGVTVEEHYREMYRRTYA
ncbi:MAG: isopenicillin N synthase family oxygenase [Pseudomonas sp.]|jgi:isopenicillin N synthase-like dioxygenase|uniref:isopenicillin N synthase family dioxygenase n=1 Tax=Pseudomonadaceae TaxID=135621 RepID=UPI0006180EE5|nr:MULTISPECIES: 2-oxoglutarate and iron-dependent oxygenase domain-containing protein [Pseudomonadaceae]MAX92093.1 isopenicillin N synthase family oxygenase [Pseudomonas sp.]MBU0950698.1 isopenicillin N synthase family oxygenase [Gammaproteobacteria bacterium]KJJ61893.1 oxidoreductase [Pseudomonas sp. 10B238]MBK3797004.1 isopenicillin N synthase family oxygenase [Stutzerimonas stutzeri]MBK3877507.1 isopenicillin N synthase family oxygenase [Stutzerimonas stutzeri]